ncbi:MAG: hypothetical protein JSV56_03870, partial [Methanomassiliicoccales archaeon]
MADLDADDVEQKKKRLISPIIILVLGTIFILWLLMMFTSKNFYDDFGMDISREWWVYIGSMVMIILIIVLLVAGFPARAPVPEAAAQEPTASISPTETETPTKKEPVVIKSAPSVESKSEMMVVEAEPIVVEAEIVEAIPVEETGEATSFKMKKPKLVEYPKKVPGGVYGDTIVRIDPLTKLNLRTLLVRSCMICDRQGKCWEEIMDS